MENYLDKIESVLGVLPPVWEAHRVHGSIIGINLGKPIQDHDKSPFYLAIEFCDWYLCHNDAVILDCIVTDDKTYEEILEKFVGKKVISIKKDPTENKIFLLFEGNYLFCLTANIDAYGADGTLFFLLSRLKEADMSFGFSPYEGFNVEKY